MTQNYQVGQAWAFDAPENFRQARIIIGAILTFDNFEPVICTALVGAPLQNANGKIEPLTIPFLPFSRSAFEKTITAFDGMAEVPSAFTASYKSWKNDAKGLGFINTPFKCLLRDMADGLHEKRLHEKQQEQKTRKIACIEGH